MFGGRALDRRRGGWEQPLEIGLKRFGVVVLAGLAAACTQNGVYREEIERDFLALTTPNVVAEVIAENCAGIEPRLGAVMMGPSEVGVALRRRYAQADIDATLADRPLGDLVGQSVTTYLSARGVQQGDTRRLCDYGRSVLGSDDAVGSLLLAG